MIEDFENQARQAIRNRDFVRLKAICHDAIRTGQSSPQIQIWAANLDREAGDYALASERYTSALTAMPNNYPGWFNLGLCLRELSRFSDAGHAFQNSLMRPGGHRPSLLQLGQILTALGRHGDAKILYEQGQAMGLLEHPEQRPSHMCPGIRTKPWWSVNDIRGLAELNTSAVREEVLSLMDSEHLGTWNSPALGQGQWQKLFFP